MIGFAVGVVTGLLSGLGVGGGTLLMLWLTLFTEISLRSAQLLNLVYFLPTVSASVIFHIRNRLVDLQAFVCAALTGTAAGILGTLVSDRLQTASVRRIFGLLLIAMGSIQILKKRK